MSTQVSKWVVDPTHSEITFKVKHMMISTVSGRFDRFNIEAETQGDDFSDATIEVRVDIDSINTNNKDRDAHLKSDDFFNATQYPQLIFKATSFDGEKLIGDLTIRDTTRQVELETEFNGIAQDPYGQTKAGFELSGEINRKDFGLMWNAVTEAGHVVVADKIKLIMGVQLVKQA